MHLSADLAAPENSMNLTIEQRSSYAGYALVGGICREKIKVSLMQERGFASTEVRSF